MSIYVNFLFSAHYPFLFHSWDMCCDGTFFWQFIFFFSFCCPGFYQFPLMTHTYAASLICVHLVWLWYICLLCVANCAFDITVLWVFFSFSLIAGSGQTVKMYLTCDLYDFSHVALLWHWWFILFLVLARPLRFFCDLNLTQGRLVFVFCLLTRMQ